MKISFYGAAREVTGSCFCVEVNGKRVLVDCGLQQGGDNGFGQAFPFHPGEIDYVIVTHAHIDHSGRLPLLVKQGFRGSIFATGATCKLLDIMLRDSAHIQELEALWATRKKRRAGDAVAQPLYTLEDALRVFPLLVPCGYKETIEIDDSILFSFTDAGHLLGSAYVEMWLTEDGKKKKLVFSGDIGTPGHPMIRTPEFIDEADVVVMESTYGDRNHVRSFDTVTELAKVIENTLSKGGNVICPSFAIGRTQDLLYHIREIKERRLVSCMPDFLVYLDSPLAKAATNLYSEDLTEYFNDETLALIDSGIEPLSFDGLRIVETSEESKRLNDDRTPKVIISSSGMCDAGRIRHHLKHNLWRSECSVVFTGFQALGTLGRIVVDGLVSSVSLFGEEIAIRCQIHNFRNMSSHADREELLKWINNFKVKPKCVFVVHGEDLTSKNFALRLVEQDFKAIAPKYTSVYDLDTFQPYFEGKDLVRRSDLERRDSSRSDRRHGEKPDSPVFQRLLLAGMRLVEVITRNKGGTNKDLAKFADQIDSLSNKWDR
ncbi:MAG: MBL fold metallo-hydrolase [Oscillospiraceae bacterium]|nr:MBL fold metallo-hydrolase [Oscillospiraceae bacterium]